MIQSFWLEDEYDETANDLVDWTKVEKDTPVYVKHKNDAAWKRRYFSHYDGGIIYCFPAGRTSWSNRSENEGVTIRWDYGKFAEKGFIEND